MSTSEEKAAEAKKRIAAKKIKRLIIPVLI